MPLRISVGVGVLSITLLVYIISLAVWIATLKTGENSVRHAGDALRDEIARSTRNRIDDQLSAAEKLTRTNALMFSNGAYEHPDRPDPRGNETDHFLRAFRSELYGSRFITTVSMTDYRGNLFGVYTNFDFSFSGVWEQYANATTGEPTLLDYETYGEGHSLEGQKKRFIGVTVPYNCSEEIWYTVTDTNVKDSNAWTPMYFMANEGVVTTMLSQSHVAHRPDGSLIGVSTIDMATGFVGSMLSEVGKKNVLTYCVDTYEDALLGSSVGDEILRCNDGNSTLEDCEVSNQAFVKPHESDNANIRDTTRAVLNRFDNKWANVEKARFQSGDFLVSVDLVIKNKLRWAVVVVERESSLFQETRENTKLMIILQSICAVLQIIMSMAFAYRVRRPLSRLIEQMDDLKRFDTDHQLEQQSLFSEIYILQKGHDSLRMSMGMVKSFVPQSVLAELGTDRLFPADESCRSESIRGESTTSMGSGFGSTGGSSGPDGTQIIAVNPLPTRPSHRAGQESDMDDSDGSSAGGLIGVGPATRFPTRPMRVRSSSVNSLDELSGSDSIVVAGSAHNMTRANAQINRFRSVVATIVVVKLHHRATTLNTTAFSAECEAFMRATIPHILKDRGIIELQRPDHVAATFQRGVHVERAAHCALKMAKAFRRAGLSAVATLHTGSFLSGSCGSAGRNAFVMVNDFFNKGIRIAELSHQCLRSYVLMTDAVAKSLPINMLAVPVDVITDGSESTILYELIRRSTNIEREIDHVKNVFKLLAKGSYEKAAQASRATELQLLQFQNERLAKLAVGMASQSEPSSFVSSPTATKSSAAEHYARHYAGWSLADTPQMHDAVEDDVSTSFCLYSTSGHQGPLVAERSRSRVNASASDSNHMSQHQAHNNSTSLAHSSSSSEGNDVDATEEVRKALTSVHNACVFTDESQSQEMHDAPLFSLAMEETPIEPFSPSRRSTQEGSAIFNGLTKAQNQLISNQAHLELDAIVPIRFMDMKGNPWLRFPQSPMLGEGAFSKVYQGMNVQGDVVALKCINLSSNAGTDVSYLETEVSVLSDIHHPNLASFISLAVHKSSMVIIVMEFVAGGTLRNLIESFKKLLPRSAVRRFATDILCGLVYLHERGVVHGDIKPENVLLGSDSVCKLTDFGSSVSQKIKENAQKSNALDDVPDLRGTAPYMSPEAARGELPTAASDVWSFGVLLHELVLGELPWEHESGPGGAARSQVRLLRGLARRQDEPGALRPRITVPKDEDETDKRLLCDLLSACFEENPSKRPSAKDLTMYGFLL